MAVILKAMNRFAPWLIAASLSLIAAPSAQALCVYQGTLYARTTLQQEFVDSPWVVRARVVSAVQGETTEEHDPWTVYRLEIVSAFKGDPPRQISVFTERNSGGFYMDRGGEGPDIGQDYLLFLQPLDMRGRPAAARDAWRTNYSCGQSRPWREVDEAAQAQLQALTTGGAE
jgi:hypothetical protein